jgi:hypothetical protein
MDCVVPYRLGLVRCKGEGPHQCIGDLDALRVFLIDEVCGHAQSRLLQVVLM